MIFFEPVTGANFGNLYTNFFKSSKSKLPSNVINVSGLEDKRVYSYHIYCDKFKDDAPSNVTEKCKKDNRSRSKYFSCRF